MGLGRRINWADNPKARKRSEMSQCEDAFNTYEKCDFVARTEPEKPKHKKAPKGALAVLSLRSLSPERAVALLYVLLALTVVFFMALTIVNLQRVSAVWEALEEARLHSASSHAAARYNLSEVQRTLDQQLSGDLKVIQDQLLRAAEKPKLELLLQQLGEMKQEQSRISSLLDATLEETRSLSAQFQSGILCRSCPKGWQEFAASCYFFSSDSSPWSEAKEHCARLSARLVVIDNEEENKFLASLVPENRVFWLGLSDREDEGHWQWMDGHSPSFTSWNSGEPNNSGYDGEDCAIFYPNGRWNDIVCSSNERWICERPL